MQTEKIGGPRVAHTPRAPAQPQLAQGWVQKFTADGAPYYENLVAKTAQWERPVAPPRHASASGAISARRAGSYQVRASVERAITALASKSYTVASALENLSK